MKKYINYYIRTIAILFFVFILVTNPDWVIYFYSSLIFNTQWALILFSFVFFSFVIHLIGTYSNNKLTKKKFKSIIKLKEINKQNEEKPMTCQQRQTAQPYPHNHDYSEWSDWVHMAQNGQYEFNREKVLEKRDTYSQNWNYEVEIPNEMYDFIKVLQHGARKYKANNWLEKDGHSSDHKSMHASMFRHLAESSTGSTADKDSRLHPLLHVAARALMVYTRQKKGLVHKMDEEK